MTLAVSPPGLEGTYLVGNLLDCARDPLLLVTRCSREYDEVVCLRFPGPPVYLLNGPDHVEQVLVKRLAQELGLLAPWAVSTDGYFWSTSSEGSTPRASAKPRIVGRRGATSFLSILPMWSRCSPVTFASSSRVMNFSVRSRLRFLPIFITSIVSTSVCLVCLWRGIGLTVRPYKCPINILIRTHKCRIIWG
jgi:hypothetical protein